MSNLAQIDRIISEVKDLDEKDKILFFRKLEEIFANIDSLKHEKISIESAFGLWKNRKITKDILRKKAWQEN
ncbi:MAG: hypothetical protein FWF73_07015 [Spirochaetes bacterium]|nr:hypothetical protein [Spirochaetota bacterium]